MGRIDIFTVGRAASYDAGIRGKPLVGFTPNPLRASFPRSRDPGNFSPGNFSENFSPFPGIPGTLLNYYIDGFYCIPAWILHLNDVLKSIVRNSEVN